MVSMRIVLILTLALLGGCAGKDPCGKSGRYMEARAVPAPVMPEGLASASESRRVRVPDAPDSVHPELRGDRVVGPDGSLRCLVEPPPLTEERRRGRG